jgi:hypothetical protein
MLKATSEMTDAEREQRMAELRAEIDKNRHDAPEPEIVPLSLCRPGAIGFMDGRFYGVSDGIEEPWRHAERLLQHFFDLLPERHRVSYWRERIEAGATALTLFFESQAYQCVGAGFINPEICGDGEPGVFAPVMTNGSIIDLSDLARIAESTALRTGARAVYVWTPEPCTVVQGYEIKNAYFGQMQSVRVRPIQ